VHGEVVLATGCDDRVDLVERPDAASRAVVRVLDRDDPGRRDVHARPVADLGDDLVRGEPTVRPLEPDGQQARVRGRPAQLRQHDVGVPLDEQGIARTTEDIQRDLIGHRRGREKDRLLVPEELGASTLELVDGGVLALLLVADCGVGDRLAHGP
jgi:hypothetical protein